MFDHLDELCRGLLDDSGNGSVSPVNLDLIVNFLKIPVICMSLDTCDGLILRNRHGACIVLNSLVTYLPRLRFTLAHEIGHFLLHENLGLDYSTAQDLWSSKQKVAAEREADEFAARLLMPRHLFGIDMLNVSVSAKVIAEKMKQFEVSLPAALYRWLSLTNLPSVVVVSKQNQVHHFKRSESAIHLWLEDMAEVPIESTAWNCSDSLDEACKMSPLITDAENWFRDFRPSYSREIFEQSFVTASGIVYTLLTLKS